MIISEASGCAGYDEPNEFSGSNCSGSDDQLMEEPQAKLTKMDAVFFMRLNIKCSPIQSKNSVETRLDDFLRG